MNPFDPEIERDLEEREQKIFWPDHARADRLFWKGDPHVPLVQRIGAWMFGIVSLGVGLLAYVAGYSDGSVLVIVFALALMAVGVKICLNGCRNN